MFKLFQVYDMEFVGGNLPSMIGKIHNCQIDRSM